MKPKHADTLFLRIFVLLFVAFALSSVLAFAVFRAQSDRFAKAQCERLVQPRIARAALGLVGDRHHRHRLGAQPAGDLLVERGETSARVDHEQRGVGTFQADLGLRAHAAGERLGVLVLPPGGVDDGEVHASQDRIAHAAVARHPGLVVDQRQLLADQPVEQRRLADVGPADDDDFGFRRGLHERPQVAGRAALGKPRRR